MHGMTSRERIEQAIVGGQVDRLPYCFWYHFRTEAWFPQALHAEYRAPASDAVLQQYIDGMSRATYEFWRRYQPDLLKVMHDIPYETPEGLPFVRTADDWAKLTPLEPDRGHFGAQIEMLRRLRAMVPDDVPIIETVFNAFTTRTNSARANCWSISRLRPMRCRRGCARFRRTCSCTPATH
jgi:uroporphyrinogen decarboxylase